jgi:conjugative relaxase-like TrwC/TraI family protein/excisionase family DNA binding protein
MLSIGKLGAGQERYYLDKVAEGAEDYYSGEGEAEGYWLGDAAEDLGLQGKVDREQLTAMLTGHNPATGEPLGMQQVSGRGPIPGFDLTFSAPKSVSLTWALGGHPAATEVAAAHRASVEAAMTYMQQAACWTRRGKGGHEFLHGNGFLAAAYTHRSSRAGDAQLHTHVLIANATRGPDGRWTRLYHPAIYDHAKTAGYIYEAHLRHELTQRLGVRWGEVRKGIAEIEGFDPAHLRAFSTRRAQILEASGPDASASARRIATLETRKAKERDLASESLRERWRAKAKEVGLHRDAIRATMGLEHQAPEATVSVAAVEAAITAHASHFDRRDAIQAVAGCLPAGAPGEEVCELADAFLATDTVVSIGQSAKGERFTTVRIWELEQRALASAEQMAGEHGRAVVDELTSARVLAARKSLKSDQRQMVERLLRDGEGISVVIGAAGTGKTYATLAAAEGWAQAGVSLRVAAPTWRAANVLRSEGLEATSIARLLAEFDRAAAEGRPTLDRDSVLLIDEAGMVDSATLARLIDHAQAAGAKLVLIGDPAQLGEIEAGGLFASLAARSDPIVLDEVIRHNHSPDREAAQRIREGHGGEALSLYRSEERVIVAADPEARREEMVRDWWQSFERGEDALMVAKRNAEVEKLNALAREVMKAEGRLGEREIEVGEARFAAGDQVITRVNDHANHIYNRERWRVAEVDPEAQAVVLDGIDTARRVCVDSVYLRSVNPRDEAPALQHAYAATTYQAQGATVDRAYVMADPSMDRQEFYVAASRSREETYFYATPEVQIEREEYAPRSPYLREGLEHIAEAAERDGAQLAAHDEALRSSLGRLSTEELARRRDELRSEAGAERQNQASHRRLSEQIAEADRSLDRYAEQAERVGQLPRRERRVELARLEGLANYTRQAAERLEGKQQGLPAVAHHARAEVAVIDHLLAERERAAFTAARISPPDYITREPGRAPERSSEAAGVGQGGARYRGLPPTARHRGQRQRARSAAGERNGAAGLGGSATAASAKPAEPGARPRPRAHGRDGDRAVSAPLTPDPRALAQPLLNANEAAHLLHVPRSTLYELVRSRGLPHVKIGSRGLRFMRTDLARWVSENTFASR